MRRQLSLGLVGALALQVLIMTGVWLNGYYPLWVGREITLVTRPVDPRDWFRGDYARLDYAISRLPVAPGSEVGDRVFVPLTPGPGTLPWQGRRALPAPPAEGLYLRGRISAIEVNGQARIRYGIEALFASRQRARALEKTLRQSAIAVVRVAPNGKAALVTVVPPAGP
ncbi:MAG: GDYXXLXY domain-containing protein [Alcanivorax sp.]|nr:GDYXXLXY domain-containing protein [Alcanivorax sp.]